MSEGREVVGKTKCLNCNESVEVKRNIKGHLYYNCSWGNGGCGCQFQSRTDDADGHLLRKLDKKEKPVEKQQVESNASNEPDKTQTKHESMWEHMA